MSLDKIREAVMKSSRSEAEHITATAEKQAKEKLEYQKENLRREYEYLYQSKSRLIEEEYSRKLAHFQGNAAKELLEAKNTCLRAIFNKAREEVLLWPEERYAQTMKRLIEKVTAGRGGNIRAHGNDRETFGKVLQEINKDRADEARLEIDTSKALPERGGFIFISGDFEVDATMKTIFDDIEQSLLPLIAQDLANI